jgi:hypothetical protein
MTDDEQSAFIELWQEGLTHEAMARQLGCPVGTVKSRLHTLQHQGKIQPRRSTAAHPSTPASSPRHTRAHPGTPAPDPTAVHLSTPTLPVPQPTQAHPGVPMPNDAAMRLLALLPDLEVIVARERDRQRLLGTPISTPHHTVKKTYVVDTLYVDLIERYAKAEGVERKDVVNLAFHEFFERRQYLPPDDLRRAP